MATTTPACNVNEIHRKAPCSSSVPRTETRPRLSWERELESYLDAANGIDALVETAPRRQELAAVVKTRPESAEAWWNFLLHEEETSIAAATGKAEQGNARTLPLSDLYRWATRLIPRQNNYKTEPFINLWLGHARQQWHRTGADDGRDTFKALKSQHIGEQYAPLYAEWAGLEFKDGNASKAASVVAKGIREGAEPQNLLKTMQTTLANDSYNYSPFWALLSQHYESGQPNRYGDHTAASLPLTAGFKTPSCAAENRHLGTPSAGGGTATITSLSSFRNSNLKGEDRPAGNIVGSVRPDPRTVVLPSASSNTLTARIRNQHPAPNTCPRSAQSGSTTSGSSTAGSDERTIPLQMRLVTPTTLASSTGGSRSHGSSTIQSGHSCPTDEEATVNLRHHASAAMPSIATKEDTVIINMPCARVTATAVALPPTVRSHHGAGGPPCELPKGKQFAGLGVRGKAMRVTPQQAASSRVAEGSESQGTASEPDGHLVDRKRKAEGEASQSPLPMPSISDGLKRRQSPTAGNEGSVRNGSLEPIPESPTRLDDEARMPMPPLERDLHPAQVNDIKRQTHPLQVSQRPSNEPSASCSRRQVVLENESSGHASAAVPGSTTEPCSMDEETAPIMMSNLAAKVQRGRQSIAPQSKSFDPEATQPLSRPTVVSSTGADVERELVQRHPVAPNAAMSAAIQRPQPSPAAAAIRPAAVQQQPSRRETMGPPPPVLSRPKQPQPQQQMKPLQLNQPPGPANVNTNKTQPDRRVIENENIINVRGIDYTKLECVGRGGSSKVYKVMAPNRKIFALKRIRLNGKDAEVTSGFLDEITLLTKLRGRSNIIQLIDSEVHMKEGLIYMVLEFGDIDLAKLLQRHGETRRERLAVTGAGGDAEQVDENFIRLYWEQMLGAVDIIHRERIVHSDLKPANFLMVEGQLKLIDFGIAKAIQSDTTSIARESQVGTLNYMSPEAILGGNTGPRGGAPVKVGRASDIWSLGCILYQMVYGRTPFAHLPFIQKMQAIIDDRHDIEFPPVRNVSLLDVMKRCLDRNPKTRISMAELLAHQFLRPEQTPSQEQATGGRRGSRGGDGGLSSSVELSQEQLRRLLLKVSQAGVSDADVSNLSEQLFQRLSHGDLSPDIVRRKAAAAAGEHRHVALENGLSGSSIQSGSPSRQQQQQQHAVTQPQVRRTPLMPILQVDGSGSAANGKDKLGVMPGMQRF